MKRTFTTFAAAAAMAASLAAAPAHAQQDEIRVGVPVATTGTFAFVGVPLVNAVRLAAEELNASNFFGGRRLNLIIEDNRSDTREAIALITRMARRDNALAIIGPISTGEAMAAGPVAVDLQIPMYTTATSPDVLRAGPWVFKAPENPEVYMDVLGRHVAEQVRARACYLVFIRDNEGFIRQKNIFRDTVAARNVRIVADESILAADTDFTALSTKIASSGADCLFLSTPPEQGANIVIQARQAGMAANVTLVGNTGMSSDRYFRTGGRAVEGTFIPAEFDPEGVNDFSRAFIRNYTARYGSAPEAFAAQAYSMMYVMAHAIRNAGASPTRESVRDAMARTRDVPVVLGGGNYTLDANRIPTYGIRVLRLREGRYVRP